jgi:K+ transporter
MVFRHYWLWLAAVICFFLALLIALGADLFSSTFDEWISGGLLALALANGYAVYRPGP